MARHPMRGWGILGTMLAILASVLVTQAVLAPDIGTFLLQSIRWTARLSFPCFLLAWSASSLDRAWSTPFSQWQMANRRYLGVTFAILHLIHAGFLGIRIAHPSGASLAERPWIDFVGGGIAYALIVAMLLTSFEPMAKHISRRAWTGLHTLGGYWVAVVFSVSYGGRALENPSFLPQALALAVAFLLHLVPRSSSR